jgi:salicylate hydroxylase
MFPPSKAYIGPDRLFTRYFIRKRTVVNVVGLVRQPGWEQEGWTIPAEISDFLDLYKEFHPDVHTIIKAVPPHLLFKWALRDREPLASWISGRVTVLGDAAHPMLPFLGQGAAMAIEDGMVVGGCFGKAESVDEALTLYERARKERANGVQIQSRQQAAMYQGSAHENYHPGRNAEGRGLFSYNPATVPI